MSAHVAKSNLPYDKEITDIVDYVINFKVTSDVAYETAWNCFMDTLGCGLEALEYEAEFLVADIGESVAVEFGNIDRVEEVATTRGPIKAAQQIHQRRFARADAASESYNEGH